MEKTENYSELSSVHRYFMLDDLIGDLESDMRFQQTKIEQGEMNYNEMKMNGYIDPKALFFIEEMIDVLYQNKHLFGLIKNKLEAINNTYSASMKEYIEQLKKQQQTTDFKIIELCKG